LCTILCALIRLAIPFLHSVTSAVSQPHCYETRTDSPVSSGSDLLTAVVVSLCPVSSAPPAQMPCHLLSRTLEFEDGDLRSAS